MQNEVISRGFKLEPQKFLLFTQRSSPSQDAAVVKVLVVKNTADETGMGPELGAEAETSFKRVV